MDVSSFDLLPHLQPITILLSSSVYTWLFQRYRCPYFWQSHPRFLYFPWPRRAWLSSIAPSNCDSSFNLSLATNGSASPHSVQRTSGRVAACSKAAWRISTAVYQGKSIVFIHRQQLTAHQYIGLQILEVLIQTRWKPLPEPQRLGKSSSLVRNLTSLSLRYS